MAGTIPDGISRIATSTEIKGFAYLQPYMGRTAHPSDPDPNKPPAEPYEGPTVIVHGLTAGIPGVPNHFITLLEAAQEISIGRMGALNAEIEILLGECQIVCRDPMFNPVDIPILSLGGEMVQFPICIAPETKAKFTIREFPKDPSNVLYIKANKTIAVFLVTRSVINFHRNHNHHDAEEPANPYDPYSGPATIMCSSGCPYHPLFGGDPT